MNKKIKILYVSHYPHYFMGGQKSMLNLIENLNQSKFTPFVLCPRKGELTEYLENINIKYFTLPLCSLKPKNILQIFKNINGVRAIIEENDIDIIHTDSERDAFICGIAKLKTSSKLIWHIRLTLDNGLDKYIIKWSDFVIGISDACKNRFNKVNYQIYLSKYKTIYNGANLNKFIPINTEEVIKLRKEKKMGDYLNYFIILFVGQIKEGKGVFDILDSVEQVVLTKDFLLSNQKYLYLFIGNFNNNETENIFLKKLNEKNLLNGNIKLMQLNQQSDIEKYMQLSDSLILPAHEGNEGMGRVLFEAMACGKPVIGSNVSGVNEAFNSNSGILIDERKPNQIAKAIIELSNDSFLYNSKALEARKQAIDNFDIKQHAIKIEEVYSNLVKKI